MPPTLLLHCLEAKSSDVAALAGWNCVDNKPLLASINSVGLYVVLGLSVFVSVLCAWLYFKHIMVECKVGMVNLKFASATLPNTEPTTLQTVYHLGILPIFNAALLLHSSICSGFYMHVYVHVHVYYCIHFPVTENGQPCNTADSGRDTGWH